jgi:hypothetical protein
MDNADLAETRDIDPKPRGESRRRPTGARLSSSSGGKRLSPRARRNLYATARVAFTIVFALSIVFGAYAAFLDVPVLAALLGALALVSAPFRVAVDSIMRIRALLFAALFAATPPLFAQVIAESQHAVDELSAKIDKLGPTGLSAIETSGVYLFGLVMVAGGAAGGYREAAAEHLDLYFDGPKTRDFTGDFAMLSRRVREPLRAFAAKLGHEGGAFEKMELQEQRIVFDSARDSQRVALALNALALSATAVRDGGRWRIDVRGRVQVKYPRRSRVTLVSVDTAAFRFEEALFWALQERGLLYPYVAEWRWTIYSDDPRIST